MIDEVRMALTALRAKGTPGAGQLSVFELEGGLGAFLAIDESGRPHLLMEVDPRDPLEVRAVAVAALEVGARELEVSSRTASFLDVTCLFESVAEVFDHFIVAVLDRLKQAPGAPATALAEVLGRWKQFLVPSQGPPGREKLATVIGELLVLLDVVRVDAAKRIDSWLGPFGGRHDIRRGVTAVEVKTTRAHTSRRVTINGEDQLEAPDGGTLHLHFVRLEEVPGGGRSVASLVDDLLSEGVPAEPLFDALSAVGIPIPELPATSDTGFEVRERFTVPIDDDFPRIVRASFLAGTLPLGVADLSYVIDLDHSLDDVLDEGAYAELIAAVGGSG